jgi:hypothetical protein
MARRPLAVGAAVLLALGVAAWCDWAPGRSDRSQDRDRDGLDDRLEASLAATHLPRIHEFAGGTDQDDCLQPRPRPVLYRARPRSVKGDVDRDTVAITYVLLYLEDCGPLDHEGDNEAFTVFLRHDRSPDRWRTVAALAIAHQATSAEQRSIGSGRDIWVSRNKHANYATFEACGDNDLSADVCAENGPAPSGYTLLNVGEPRAPLSDDVGDVMLEAGVPPAATRPDDERSRAYRLFRGHRIWNHERFLNAGDITAQLFVGMSVSVAPDLRWEAEDQSGNVLLPPDTRSR